MNNKRNKKWFAVFAAIIVSIFAIQTFSRINFAQDPPKSKKDKQMVVIRNAQDDTSKMGSLPPPPPPPPPFPYFSGTSDFNESNMAFGNYILKNIQVSPADFAGKKKKSGVFVVISFDNKGNVLNAEKGFIPKGFSSDDVKFTEDQTIISELIKVIKNAPAFTIENSEDGYLSQVNYGIIYGDNTCKVMPVHYVFKDNTDSPVSPKVSLPKDM